MTHEQMKTCSSLTEAEFARSREDNFRTNFIALSQAKLSQTLAESLLRIDHCTESILLKLPTNIRTMKVADFVAKYPNDCSLGEFVFEALPVKRSHADMRSSGEALRKKVRQQLADTKTTLSLSLPGTRPFLEMGEAERSNVISILSAVVSTYTQAHRDDLN